MPNVTVEVVGDANRHLGKVGVNAPVVELIGISKDAAGD